MEDITMQDWKDFQEHPVFKKIIEIIKERRRIIRDCLEFGSLRIDSDPIERVFFLRGRSETIIWFMELLTKYEQVLKDQEKLEESKEKESKGEK